MNILLDNYLNEEALEQKAIREGFGEGIVQAAHENENLVVLNADLPGSLKLEAFMEKYPERFIQVGVAEQNMAGIATGLDLYGKLAFITSFAAFSPGLNFSQIRLAAIGGQNLKIVASHYGLNIGPDGASAQMNADISMMKALPGMTILNPADYNQAIQATKAMANHKGMSYLRVTRSSFPVFINPESNFEIGKAQILSNGNDATVISTGSMVYETIQALQPIINEGKSFDLINLHTIKPLDTETILNSIKKTGALIVTEEHNVFGGVGESIAALSAQNQPVKTLLIGIKDTFGESGGHLELWQKYGLDRKNIENQIRKFLEI